jgi:hypothetical protein
MAGAGTGTGIFQIGVLRCRVDRRKKKSGHVSCLSIGGVSVVSRIGKYTVLAQILRFYTVVNAELLTHAGVF